MNDEERESLDIELFEQIKEGWKDEWNGLQTLQNMLCYLSFIFIGVGIGTIALANDALVELHPEYTKLIIDTLGEHVKEHLLIATIGFLSCHAAMWLLESKLR